MLVPYPVPFEAVLRQRKPGLTLHLRTGVRSFSDKKSVPSPHCPGIPRRRVLRTTKPGLYANIQAKQTYDKADKTAHGDECKKIEKQGRKKRVLTQMFKRNRPLAHIGRAQAAIKKGAKRPKPQGNRIKKKAHQS